MCLWCGGGGGAKWERIEMDDRNRGIEKDRRKAGTKKTPVME